MFNWSWLKQILQRLFSISRLSTQKNPKTQSVHPIKTVHPTAVAVEKNTPIDQVALAATQYQHDLIPTLEHTHQQLLYIYQEINQFIDKKHYNHIAEQLLLFKEMFAQHSMLEHHKLYRYLEQNTENAVLIKEFQEEIRQITYEVVKFLQKWASTPLNERNIDEFETAYLSIKQVLLTRIQREENELYPHYQPLNPNPPL